VTGTDRSSFVGLATGLSTSLEQIIGRVELPLPGSEGRSLLYQLMRREHVDSENAQTMFSSMGVQTCPWYEWLFIFDRTALLDIRRTLGAELCAVRHGGEGRERTPPFDGIGRLCMSCQSALHGKNAQLRQIQAPEVVEEEVAAGCLYSGCMYSKYINVLQSREAVTNKFTTTIFLINSLILKLSKLSEYTKLYKCLSDPLPTRLFTGLRGSGVVDRAFIQCTVDREAALAAAQAAGAGTVLDIEQTFNNEAADIGWVHACHPLATFLVANNC
jgi:hypothetical protein